MTRSSIRLGSGRWGSNSFIQNALSGIRSDLSAGHSTGFSLLVTVSGSINDEILNPLGKRPLGIEFIHPERTFGNQERFIRRPLNRLQLAGDGIWIYDNRT